MSNLYRILLFVPPILLFFVPAYSQVQGALIQIPGNDTYQVSVVPSVNWSPPASITSSAQITIRAHTGTLQLTDFQGLQGSWSAASPIVAPAEAPGFDYFSFSLQAPIANLNLTAGTPVPIFNFKNSLGCTYIEIVDNSSDPFLPPNSISANIGNSFSMLGSGIGNNAYAGNSADFSVACPPLGILAAAANNPVNCYGDKTDILLTAQGGVPPYQIDWTNLAGTNSGIVAIPSFEGSVSLPQMPADQYTFIIKDALDSLLEVAMSIGQPSPLTIEIESFDASCNGSLDGVAFVDKVHGGTPAYQYFWDINPSVSNQTIDLLNPGTYEVTVVDINGCQTSGSVDVGTFFVIFPNPVIKDISCYGENNGVIDLYPVSPNAPYTYQWSENVTTPDNLSSAWQLSPGFYSVTIYDATGVCYEVAEYEIVEPEALQVDYKLTEPVCFGEKGHLEILGVSNAVGAWTSDVLGGKSLGNGFDFELEPGLPQQLIVQDSLGCEATEEFVLPAKQQMILELEDGQSIKYGQEVQIDPNVFPFNNVSFQWTPSEGLSCSDCPNPVAKPLETVSYHLKMTDSAGCTLEDEIVCSVHKSRDVFIPNAFSPNHDGINDRFCPYGGFEVTAIKDMKVFDRWGGKVFESNDSFLPSETSACWDGTAHGKEAVAGTYIFTMNVEFIDGIVVLFSGEVNLVR